MASFVLALFQLSYEVIPFFMKRIQSVSDRFGYWVAVRRTYVFTLQEVEKICRTLQSHVMQVWTMTFWLLAPDPDKAEPLPVLSNKLPFFSTDALAQIA